MKGKETVIMLAVLIIAVLTQTHIIHSDLEDIKKAYDVTTYNQAE